MNRYEKFKRYIKYDFERKCIKMLVKTLPEHLLSKGYKIIFHSECVGCVAQGFEGAKRCLGCMYFDTDWSKPDLSYNIENRLERIEALKKVTGRNNKIDSILEED